MQFTYKDLEQLTDVAYHLLRQWKQHGYIWDNGTGTGAGGTVCQFDAEMIGRIMWLAHMQQVNKPPRDALALWEEALRPCNDVLIMTGSGHEWVRRDLYDIKVGRLYLRHHTFFTISVEHFLEAANKRLNAFIEKRPESDVRSPPNFPTVGKSNNLVH